jgi:HAMP domain-containing protein
MEQRTSTSDKARPRKVKNGHDGGSVNGNGNGKAKQRLAPEPPVSIHPHRGARRRPSEALDREQLLTALVAFKKGDFSARLPIHLEGLDGKIADTFNDVVELNDRMAKELERLGRVVGKEGKISQRASIGEVSGAWSDTVASVNALVSDLVHPTSETARVIGAVAKGDLSQTMALEVSGRPLEGEFLRTAKTVNTMVDQLRDRKSTRLNSSHNPASRMPSSA